MYENQRKNELERRYINIKRVHAFIRYIRYIIHLLTGVYIFRILIYFFIHYIALCNTDPWFAYNTKELTSEWIKIKTYRFGDDLTKWCTWHKKSMGVFVCIEPIKGVLFHLTIYIGINISHMWSMVYRNKMRRACVRNAGVNASLADITWFKTFYITQLQTVSLRRKS